MYWTFCVAILSVCLLREAETRRQLNFLKAAGSKETSSLNAGGKETGSKEVGSKEAGGKEVGSKEVGGFLADFTIASL